MSRLSNPRPSLRSLCSFVARNSSLPRLAGTGYNIVHAHPRQIPRRTARHAGAIPQRRRAATGRNARAARSANGPRRALLLPADLPGPDRSPRGRSNWRKTSCKASAAWSRTWNSAAASPAAACWACSSARGGGPPPRPVVQSALHGGEVQDRAAGDVLRQAEAARAWSGRCRIPRSIALGEEDEEPQGRILPVYPLTEGLQQWQMRKIVAETVAAFGHLLEEIFPDEYLQAHNLWPLRPGDPADPRPRQRRTTGRRAAAAGLPGAFPAGAGAGRQAASAARAAAGPAAGGHGPDRRPHPPPLPLRADRRASGRRSPRSGPTWAGRCR